jgi:hypothetical protein
LINIASDWSGVDLSNINHLVATLERRLGRNAIKNAKGLGRTTDSESDGEHIDMEQAVTDLSEEASSQILEHETKDVNKGMPPRAYRLGSQNWRGSVHKKLARGSRSKGTELVDSSPSETDELISEESGSN